MSPKAPFSARVTEQPDSGLWTPLHAAGNRLPCREGFAAAAAAPVRFVEVLRGDRPAMLLPFWARRRRGMNEWIAPPFAPFSGVVVADDEEGFLRDAFAAAAAAVPKDVDRAEIILPPGLCDARGLVWNGWVARPHYNYLTQWDAEGAWRAQIESSARRQARKAREAGLVAEVLPAGRTERLADLWRRNAPRQKLDASLDERIRAIGAWLDATGSGFVVEVNQSGGACEAAGLFGHDGSRVAYLAGASDPEALGSGAPTLLHEAVLEEIDRRGLPRCYDWVGANTPSVAQFKRKFGPRLETLIAVRREGTMAALAGAARRVLR